MGALFCKMTRGFRIWPDNSNRITFDDGLSGERAAGHGGSHLGQNSFDFFRFVFINIENRIFKCKNIKNIFP